MVTLSSFEASERLANELIASAHRKGPNKRYDEWMALEFENLKVLERKEVWKNVCIIQRDIDPLKKDPRFENSPSLQNAEKIRTLIEGFIPLDIRKEVAARKSVIGSAVQSLSSASQRVMSSVLKPLQNSFDQMPILVQGAILVPATYYFYQSSPLTKILVTHAATKILSPDHFLGKMAKGLAPFIIFQQTHNLMTHLIDNHIESIPIAGISKDLIHQAQNSYLFCRRILALGQYAALGNKDMLGMELTFMAAQYAIFSAPRFINSVASNTFSTLKWGVHKIWS